MSRRVTERIKAREAKLKPAAPLTTNEEVAAGSKPDLDKPAKVKPKKLK